ncbi:MAG: acyl-CoA dehydrogenase family protein [Steroidobacteraceae bacterium]
MSDFSPSDRETELSERTRKFIRDKVIPFENDPRNGPRGPSDELLRQLRDEARRAGLFAPQVSSRWGGLGLTHSESAAVFRASGYSLLGPLAMNCMAPDEGNMFLLERVATPEQQERFLRPVAAGSCRSTFFMTEPHPGAGADPDQLQTTAARDGHDWIINGRKWFITGAGDARVAIIMARTDAGATLFLTEMDSQGITVERLIETIGDTMPGGHGVVQLDNLRIPSDQVLGEVNQGFRYAQLRLAPARLTHCMRWWGAAQRAHDIATDYANVRRAFGKTLIEHEGVGFSLARNQIDLLQCRLMIDYVAWLLDKGQRAGAESSMAKFSCAETLFTVVDRCVQILGGQGVSHETVVAQIFQGIRGFRIYDGPSEVHLWALARRLARDHSRRATIQE